MTADLAAKNFALAAWKTALANNYKIRFYTDPTPTNASAALGSSPAPSLLAEASGLSSTVVHDTVLGRLVHTVSVVVGTTGIPKFARIVGITNPLVLQGTVKMQAAGGSAEWVISQDTNPNATQILQNGTLDLVIVHGIL